MTPNSSAKIRKDLRLGKVDKLLISYNITNSRLFLSSAFDLNSFFRCVTVKTSNNWSRCHSPQYLRQPERICNVKGNVSKRDEKKERTARKKIEKFIGKKNNNNTRKRSPNFGLYACTKLKYCTFLYLIFGNLSFG